MNTVSIHQIHKGIVHAPMKVGESVLAYGMSAIKLADTIQITTEEAEALINKFFKAFPRIKSFLDRLGSFGVDNGYIRTYRPYRRIRWFPEWYSGIRYDYSKKGLVGSIERRSKNSPIQGSNGDLMKQAMIDMRNEINKHKYPVKILLQVYDELQTECRADFAEEWKPIMEKIMIRAAKSVIIDIPVTVDCSISDYWTK